MQLTRATVTVASRVMLPTYVALFAILGIAYILAPVGRLLESPALAYASDLIPLPGWGGVFLACAALMSAALCTRSRALYSYALWVGIVALSVWSVVFVLAAVFGSASPSTWVWPAFAARACYATAKSLTVREV